jgi:hypothetical protein
MPAQTRLAPSGIGAAHALRIDRPPRRPWSAVALEANTLIRMIEVSPIRASCWKPGLPGIDLEEERRVSRGRGLAGCEDILRCSSRMSI